VERTYSDLADVDAALAARLIDAYGRRWLDQAGLPMRRLAEVPDTVELLVRTDEDAQVLRLTSWYTGSTYWLYEWDGEETRAVEWILDVADLQAGNVQTERLYGPTAWDTD
jgi:hypothetical protein